MGINIIFSFELQKQCIEVPLSIVENENLNSILDRTRLREIFPEICLLEPNLREKKISTSYNQLKNGDKIIFCRKLSSTPQSIRRIKQNRMSDQ